jgi:FKBP-type peptidyl-prolyl cis-trans isomerases 2
MTGTTTTTPRQPKRSTTTITRETHDHDEAAEEGLQNGDFVRLGYDAYTVETGQLVDTTDESVAEEEGVDTEGQEFGPRTIVLGEGGLFDPVEDDVVGREVGDSATVTVPATEAFGEHDTDEVRTISVEKLPEDDRYPGANVQIDGEQGFVETVIGGRARVDFNHPLAGEEVEYDYEILEEVEDRVEQAKGLFSMYVDVDLEMRIQTDEVEEEVTVTPDEDEEGDEDEAEAGDDADEEPPEPRTETEVVEKETLYIEATPQLTMNQQWMFSKQQVSRQVMEKLGLDRVIVQETIEFTGGQPGMMGGMGGMMGGMDGGEGEADVEEIVEELE